MAQIDSSNGTKFIKASMEIGFVRDAVGQANKIHDNLLKNQSVVILPIIFLFVRLIKICFISLAKFMELDSLPCAKCSLYLKLQRSFSPKTFQSVSKAKLTV